MCNLLWTLSLNHTSYDRNIHDAAQSILPTASLEDTIGLNACPTKLWRYTECGSVKSDTWEGVGRHF